MKNNIEKNLNQKPESLYGKQGTKWHRKDLKQKIKKEPLSIPGAGGTMYSREQRKKMIDEVFPEKRFGTHISDIRVKQRLRELRKEKFRAKTSLEKREIQRKASYLERFTGLKKY